MKAILTLSKFSKLTARYDIGVYYTSRNVGTGSL